MNKKELESGTQINLQFEKRGGLIPVVVQDVNTKDILMLGYANEAAWEETRKTGLATFWSTSRSELWTKGKTSGDYLEIRGVLVDCDQDAIIYQVHPVGSGACHTKNQEGKARKSCFFRKVEDEQLECLEP